MIGFLSPPPARRPNPLFHTLPAGTHLVRLYDPARYGATAISFRHNGPRVRFDHHRHPSTAPADDPDRGIYYAALTLSGCVVEIFTTGQISPAGWHLARPQITRDVMLLDLRGSGALRAGTTAQIAKTEHHQAQAWSRHFYDDLVYGACDGLIYFNAHNDEPAVALFERAGTALVCPPSSILLLDHPAIRPLLLRIAAENHLICGP